MSVDTLISVVREKMEKEKERLREEHDVALRKEKEDTQQRIAEKKREAEEEVSRKKKELIEDYREEKEFSLRMRLLEEKKRLLEEAVEEVAKKVADLPQEKREELYLREIEEIKHLLHGKVGFLSPSSRMEEVKRIMKRAGLETEVKEAEIDMREGFVVKGEEFVARISLEDAVRRMIKENERHLLDLLFSEE